MEGTQQFTQGVYTYRVVYVKAGCGGKINYNKVETMMNEQAQQGFVLDKNLTYDIAGFICCPKKSCIMVFKYPV